jgi:hypothetical protein
MRHTLDIERPPRSEKVRRCAGGRHRRLPPQHTRRSANPCRRRERRSHRSGANLSSDHEDLMRGARRKCPDILLDLAGNARVYSHRDRETQCHSGREHHWRRWVQHSTRRAQTSEGSPGVRRARARCASRSRRRFHHRYGVSQEVGSSPRAPVRELGHACRVRLTQRHINHRSE